MVNKAPLTLRTPVLAGQPTPPEEALQFVFVNGLAPGVNATDPLATAKSVNVTLEGEPFITKLPYGSIAAVEGLVDQCVWLCSCEGVSCARPACC